MRTKQNPKRKAYICIYLILSFSILKFIPVIGQPITDIWTLFVALFLLKFFYYNIIKNQHKLTSLEIYSIILISIITIAPAVSAMLIFDQPIVYGILSLRDYMLIGSAIIIIYYYRLKAFTLEELEKSFIYIVWLYSVLYLLLHVFINPSDIGEQTGFISGGLGEEHEGAKLLLFPMFSLFGVFFYSFRCNRIFTYSDLWKSLFMLTIMFIYGGRSALLTMIIVYLFLLWRWSKPIKFFTTLSLLILGAAAIFIMINLLNQEAVSAFVDKFIAALDAIITNTEGNDVSANARLRAMDIAMPYINDNPIFGNGKLSQHWNDGYTGLFGYFQPSDLGIFGVIFQFGFAGLLLFLYQFLFAFNYSKIIPNHGYHLCDFGNAIKAYLLYIFISSVFTGYLVYNAEHSVIFISILYLIRLNYKSLQIRTALNSIPEPVTQQAMVWPVS